MKTGQIFWGVFLLTLGALFLLVRNDIVYIDFSFVWDLWPLVFVFWGLSLLAKDTIFKPVTTVLFALLLAVFIIGSISDLSDMRFNSEEWKSSTTYDSETFSEPYVEGIETASLQISAGAGVFILNGTTEELISGKHRGGLFNIQLNKTLSDENADIRIEFNDSDSNPIKDNFKNKLELKLNPEPFWEIDLEIGAAKTDFDLHELKLKELNIKTGASKTRLKLGSRVEMLDVDIEMGAASLEILIPSEAGCQITGEMVMMIKNINGFSKNDSNNYITENFEKAENKILIDIQGGVSTIKVNRY